MKECVFKDDVLKILEQKNAAFDGYAKVKYMPTADVVERDCFNRLLAENDDLRKRRPTVIICKDCYAYRTDPELARAAYCDPGKYCGVLRCEMPEYGFCWYGCHKSEINTTIDAPATKTSYIPSCPVGEKDCVNDPAYIQFTDPEWYKEKFGDMTVLEAAEECKKLLAGKDYCPWYDDEDK